MFQNEKIEALQRQVEELAENLQKIGERQNSQYTDVMLALKKIEEQTSENQADNVSDDVLYEAAKKVVIESQKASASLIQRTLMVGYSRAARLLDLLEEEGVVGKQVGANPRDVLIEGEEDEGS